MGVTALGDPLAAMGLDANAGKDGKGIRRKTPGKDSQVNTHKANRELSPYTPTNCFSRSPPLSGSFFQKNNPMSDFT